MCFSLERRRQTLLHPAWFRELGRRSTCSGAHNDSEKKNGSKSEDSLNCIWLLNLQKITGKEE